MSLSNDLWGGPTVRVFDSARGYVYSKPMGDARLRLEHAVVRELKGVGGRWLLAVSGGVDSMVMAEVLRRWARGLGVEILVAHIHHGSAASAEQKRYRERARRHVRNWCHRHGIAFMTNRAQNLNLKSEADLRAYRLKWLAEWKAVSGASHLVFAHHQDDLLETRLLRLIRGTGGQGLKSMHVRQGSNLRPLLHVSKAEIEAYARARQLKFVDDPSNRDLGPLRNWLRYEWLPALEKKRPGAGRAMGRSLEILSEIAVVESKNIVGLRRNLMRENSLPQAEKMVAQYLKQLGVRNYGRGHVREVLKRLSGGPKTPFEMLGLVFEFTPDHLRASRV